MPDRITLSRAKGWKMPANTVKVDRSTCYGSPWRIGNPGQLHLRTMPRGYHARLPIDQASAVEAFRLWMTENPAWWMLPPPDYFTIEGRQSLWAALNFQRNAILQRLPDLRGKNLACWCKPGTPCHADVLIEVANGPYAADGWLIHKAGRGWYRPGAWGYTLNPAEAGRFSRVDAMRHSHPNGPSGPRDGMKIFHESEVKDA